MMEGPDSDTREHVVQVREREHREQVTAIGHLLRSSVRTPTDTYITDDIPTLLTRLGQVPAVSNGKMR